MFSTYAEIVLELELLQIESRIHVTNSKYFKNNFIITTIFEREIIKQN